MIGTVVHNHKAAIELFMKNSKGERLGKLHIGETKMGVCMLRGCKAEGDDRVSPKHYLT